MRARLPRPLRKGKGVSAGFDVTAQTWFPPRPACSDAEAAALVAAGRLANVLCPVCGQRVTLERFKPNLRESGICPNCGSWTRLREVASVVMEATRRISGRSVSILPDVAGVADLRIYNTEAHGALHDALAAAPGYLGSEYFGPEFVPGTIQPNGVRHEDLQRLSLGDESFDLIISTDVFEHVPDPYRAHREVFRVLRPGGHHVFTVPYSPGATLDDVRATMDADGRVHHLAEPEYHEDPMRLAEGALVFTVFGLQMIPELARIGFEVTMFRPFDPGRGLVTPDGAVFDAAKPAA